MDDSIFISFPFLFNEKLILRTRLFNRLERKKM